MTDSEIERIIAECEANAVPDEAIDTSEIPPITDFSNFHPLPPEHRAAGKALLAEYRAKAATKDVPSAEFYRPKKEQVSIRFNSVLVDHFKSWGQGLADAGQRLPHGRLRERADLAASRTS